VTDEERSRCLRTLWAIAPDHNLYRVRQDDAPDFGYEPCREGLRIKLKHTRLATYDNDLLTRLVVAAHVNYVRVEIAPCNMQTLEVTVHPRRPDGPDLYSRHPGMERFAPNERNQK